MVGLFRRIVAHNFALKLISLALAVGLWLAVSRQPMAEVAVQVPIEFQNMPDNLEISSEHIPEAQIRLRGPQRLVHRLQSADVHAEIDLIGAKAGERTFDLTAQQVHQPYDFEVVQVVPSQFHLRFDTRETRQVEIHPRVVGSFAAGYSISRVVVTPRIITITGPRERVEAVQNAITDPVDATGIMDRGTFATHAYVSDPMVQLVNASPISVTVIIEKDSGATVAR